MTTFARKMLGAMFRLPFFPLWLAPSLLLAPVFLAGKALFWGTPGLQFVPWWSWSWRTLLSGHLPLWNPLVGMGAPLIANYQSALFYPPNWLYFVLAALGGDPLLAWGQALLVVLHLALAGIGTAWLVKKLGLGVLSQTVAGLAYGLSGYLVARAGFLSINAAAAWLPWLLGLGLDLGRHSQGVRETALRLAGISGLQLLAGHAQTTAYSLLMVIAWTGFWAWRGPAIPGQPSTRDLHSPLRRIVRAWGWTLAGLAGGFALAAVQLFPTAEYLIQSQRASAVEYEFAMTYSFWPWRLLSFIAPDFYGSPVQGNYWGYGAYWEDAVYIGLLPFLLAMGVILRRFWPVRRDEIPGPDQEPSGRPLITALTIWLGITFLLALGQNTPLYPWLYRHVPGVDMFQAPTRFMLWAEISLAVLAAFGVSRWVRPKGRALYWTRLGTAGAVAVALGAGLAWAFLGEIQPTFIRATALAGFWGTGIGLLSLTAPEAGNPSSSQVWAWAVTGLLSMDLIFAGWGLNPGIDLDFYRGAAPGAAAVRSQLGEGRLFLDPADEYSLKFDRFLQFSSFSIRDDWRNLRAALLPNIHLLDGIRHTANFDPLIPGRYSDWVDQLQEAPPALRERLLNLAGVTVVEITDSTTSSGVSFEGMSGGARFFWVPCALAVGGREEAWAKLVDGDFDPETGVLVEGVTGSEIQICDENASGQVRMLDESPNALIFQVQAESPGWLLVADSWYPGWQVRIDGERVELHPANYLFRAVRVPAGPHRVALDYRPGWFFLGLLLSCLAVAFLGGLYARSRT